MPKSAVQQRCYYCNRVLYGTDFVRGLAICDPDPTLDDPGRQIFAHTYDCENAKRRLLTGEEASDAD